MTTTTRSPAPYRSSGRGFRGVPPRPLDWTGFDRWLAVVERLGLNTIPLPEGAKGAGGTGVVYRQLNKPRSRRVNADDLARWRVLYAKRQFEGVVGAYLLTSSGIDTCYAIVDIDDEAYLERALETFGPTPLSVSRSGRVRHLYYRCAPDDTRAAHLLGAWGGHTVDVISSTGVVAPGSLHADGERYALSIPLEQWTEDWAREHVPMIDLEAVDKLRRAKHGAPATGAILPAPVRMTSAGFRHMDRPHLHPSGYILSGYVFPGTIIETVERGLQPLASLTHGTRCYASYRPDTSPSAEVRKRGASVYFYDFSESRYWEMVAVAEFDDPEIRVEAHYHRHLIHRLERLGIETLALDPGGYLGEQLGELGDGVTFLVAPHGTGKTVYARGEHARAESSISVANTQALTIANAAVLGLGAVYEGVEDIERPRNSVCIPSILQFKTPPEFLHVDEADAVHRFLHSGIVRTPRRVWARLLDLAAGARRVLIASADLQIADIDLYARAIRRRDPSTPLRALVRLPGHVRESIEIRHVSAVKESIHAALSRPQTAPVYVGVTSRRLAGDLAQGYAAVSSRVWTGAPPTTHDELCEALDDPEQAPLAVVVDALADETPTTASAPIYISGENNRHHRSVGWLADPSAMVRAHDLIVASPAIQSGLSLDPPIARVFVLHAFRSLPADTVIQLARRARDLVEPVITIGVNAWDARATRDDRAYLDALVERRTRASIAALRYGLPDLTDRGAAEHVEADEADADFLYSWRIFARRTLRADADPIGELRATAQRHGLRVVVALEHRGDSAPFSRVVRAARRARGELRGQTVAAALALPASELALLARAPRLEQGEAQRIDHTEIRDFYGADPTPELVVRDRAGRRRKIVRDYTDALLVAVGLVALVASADHKASAGEQPTARTHRTARALLSAELCALAGAGYLVDDARELVRAWWLANRASYAAFFQRTGSPRHDDEARWLGDRLRALGAVITTEGASASRRKVVDWAEVADDAKAQIKRMQK